MRFSSRVAVANSCIALLICGFDGPARSQITTSPPNTTSVLPGVMVEAPEAKHKLRQHAVVHNAASHLTSTHTSSADPTSVTAKLAKLASATSSCAGGCQTSFRTGNAPWHGCSWSAGVLSPTCRNTGGFKTYNECSEAGLLMGWRSGEVTWYCSSLALK